MKKAVALILLVVSTAVFATPQRYLYEDNSCSAGTCTASAPSGASAGMSLYPVQYFRVTVCAASGQTLSGAGTIEVWLYHPDKLLWMHNTGLDLAVTNSSVRCQAFPDMEQVAMLPGFRMELRPNGVTVSGGATLGVYVDARLYGER